MKIERVVGRGKGMYRFLLLVNICCVFILLLGSASAADKIDQEKLSKWAGAICRDLGCMSISTQYYGVNMTAIGLVQDQSILKGYGFTFGEGPYRVSATRIDTGRYRVLIQAMSRPNDNEWKQIRLKTEADRIYPVAIPAAPAGKYFWNAQIQFDMEDQLGIIPHYEMDPEPVGFVDLRIIDPDKFATAGFPGYKKNDTASQIIYKGGGKWEFNPGGVRPGRGMLMYTDGQWSSSGAATAASKPTETAAVREEKKGSESGSQEKKGTFSANPFVLVKVPATGMTYNKTSYEWVVYEGRISDRVYYLVTNPDMGQALIDIKKSAMFDAETAVALPGGDGMTLEMDALPRIGGSGAKQTVRDTGKKVEAWWGEGTLSFIVGEAVVSGKDTAETTAAAEIAEETSEEPDVSAIGLLFENSDFEMGNLTNWTADGDAFDFQPTKGDNPTARGRRSQPSQHQGEFWIGTFEKYQGGSNERVGGRQGDRPTGTLTSVPFEIKTDKITFLVGGGKHKDREMVSLVVDGRIVMSATGKGNETLKPAFWDVSTFKGQTAQIVIKDEHKGGWGHINADDFRYP